MLAVMLGRACAGRLDTMYRGLFHQESVLAGRQLQQAFSQATGSGDFVNTMTSGIFNVRSSSWSLIILLQDLLSMARLLDCDHSVKAMV